MESLQNWELLGKNCINSGLYWGSEAGNYYDILERRGVAARGANYAFAKGSATPTGDYKFGLKFLLLLFMGEKQALPAGGFYSAGKAVRRQVRETSER